MPRRLLAHTATVVTVGALVVLGLVLVPAHERPVRGPGSAQPSRGPRAESSSAVALDVLHAWDRRRAAAYASGSLPGLRALYAPGSAAGEADQRLLRGYLARGLRVTGMRTQVLALRVLDDHGARWRVAVTDRLAHAVAVRAGRRVLLPRDRPDARILSLARGTDGRWRVVEVRTAS